MLISPLLVDFCNILPNSGSTITLTPYLRSIFPTLAEESLKLLLFFPDNWVKFAWWLIGYNIRLEYPLSTWLAALIWFAFLTLEFVRLSLFDIGLSK